MYISVIYENLCIKDKRNPLHLDIYDKDEEAPKPRDGCYCDNCFYGRDKLAIEIIELKEEIEDLASFCDQYR